LLIIKVFAKKIVLYIWPERNKIVNLSERENFGNQKISFLPK